MARDKELDHANRVSKLYQVQDQHLIQNRDKHHCSSTLGSTIEMLGFAEVGDQNGEGRDAVSQTWLNTSDRARMAELHGMGSIVVSHLRR